MKIIINSLLFLVVTTFSVSSVAFCVHNNTDISIFAKQFGPNHWPRSYYWSGNGKKLEEGEYACCPHNDKQCRGNEIRVKHVDLGQFPICNLSISSKDREVWVNGTKKTGYTCDREEKN